MQLYVVLVCFLRMVSGSYGTPSVARFPVDVSFDVGSTGQLNMHVSFTNRSKTFQCFGLYDDMQDAIEVRAENGTLIQMRGSNGILLYSSSDGVECRLRLHNAAGDPYTAKDVPSAPGVLSALIVTPLGVAITVEKYEDGFFALMNSSDDSDESQDSPSLQRRLDGYVKFSCRSEKMRHMKTGVIVDKVFSEMDGNSNKATAIEKLRLRWEEASVPFEQQLNVRLVLSRIVFHDDPEASGFSFAGMCSANGDFDFMGSLKVLRRFRASPTGKGNALWVMATGCPLLRRGVAGLAYRATVGGGLAIGSVRFRTGFRTLTHEIGHTMGARHTFGSEHGQPQGAGNGIMDYHKSHVWDGVVQFHTMHDDEMCLALDGLGVFPSAQIWETRTSLTKPSTTTFAPTRPSTTTFAPTKTTTLTTTVPARKSSVLSSEAIIATVFLALGTCMCVFFIIAYYLYRNKSVLVRTRGMEMAKRGGVQGRKAKPIHVRPQPTN